MIQKKRDSELIDITGTSGGKYEFLIPSRTPSPQRKSSFLHENINRSRIFNPQAKIIANLDRVLEYLEKGNTAPVLVEVDPSNICNHGCTFCLSSYVHARATGDFSTSNRATMPEDMLFSLCNDLIDLKVKAINWTGGGEPTVNPALGKVINFVGRNSEIKMGAFTNGTLIHKFGLLDILVDNLVWVRFSIDAGTAETYNNIRRTRAGSDWNRMMDNLNMLIQTRRNNGSKLKIGVGFVITPDNCHEIVDFARGFVDMDVDYCQYKPEIVNREREGGLQRTIEFWKGFVEQSLAEAESILGEKFQINGYKLNDLTNDTEFYGRTYKKCLGSQIQPCVGADGHVYVCTNHRGYSDCSYGSLYERSFIDIWNDVAKRNKVMHRINEVERFCNCTKLCKPHESNKMMWYISENRNDSEFIDHLRKIKDDLFDKLDHSEFI